MGTSIDNKKAWSTFRMILLGIFFTVLSMSFVTPAVPLITAHFGIAAGNAAWMSLGFAMGATVFQPVFGWVGDNFGRRKLLLGGLLTFTIGSLVIAMAPSFTFIVIGRFLQGLGSAAVVPVGMAYAASGFSKDEQGKAFGLWGMITAISAIVGPTIGGLLAVNFGWEAIYLTSAALAAIALIASLIKLPEIPATSKSVFDWGGTILLLLLMSGLLNIPTFINSFGITSWYPYAWFGLFVVASFFFVKHEKKQKAPLVDINYAKTRTFWAPTLAVFLQYISFQGALLLLSYFITQVQGKEATITGIIMIPLFTMLAVGSTVSGKMLQKHAAKKLATIGIIVYLVGLAGFLLLNVDTGLPYLLVTASLLGLGLGIVTPAFISIIVSKADVAKMGSTTASYNMFKDIGGPFGSSIAIVLYSILTQSQSLITSITTTVAVLLACSALSLIPLALIPGSKSKTASNESNKTA